MMVTVTTAAPLFVPVPAKGSLTAQRTDDSNWSPAKHA
jgi:hypothetical protein